MSPGSIFRRRRRRSGRAARRRAAATVGILPPGRDCAPALLEFRSGLIAALAVWAAITLPLLFAPF